MADAASRDNGASRQRKCCRTDDDQPPTEPASCRAVASHFSDVEPRLATRIFTADFSWSAAASEARRRYGLIGASWPTKAASPFARRRTPYPYAF